MAKPYDTWTVTPHGAIEKLTENLWRVQARLPGTPIDRVMLVAKLANGELVVNNAIALGDAEMKEIEAWGKITHMIVPNAGHRMDARIWKQRYPDMKVVAPAGSKAKIEEVVKVDDTEGKFGDDAVRYEILGGTTDKEGVMIVKSKTGTTIAFCDAIMNMKSAPGFGGFLMGLVGFTGPKPKVTFPAKMSLVKDKAAMRASLEKLAATEGLVRVEVAHGEPITESAADAIRGAAAGL
jgi:hypothetical protein